MRRYTFITLSTFYALTFLFVVSMFIKKAYITMNDHSVTGFFMLVLFGFLVILLSLLITAVFSFPALEGFFLFPLGVLTFFNYKRIYHSEMGIFYMTVDTIKDKYSEITKITVYEQSFLYCKEKFEIEHKGDMNVSRILIEDKLNEMYKKKLERLRIENSAKNWDGYLDKKSKRDDILNRLVK